MSECTTHLGLRLPFPGEFAGASLKRVLDARSLVCDRRVFPRRIRRGVIEAGALVTGIPLAGAFPRRIRRGVIEAR